MRACVHACMHACMHVRACVHACMRACVHACMRACVHACKRACVHSCMRTCVHTHMYVCTCMYFTRYIFKQVLACQCGTWITRAVLRLECSLDCISGSVGHQQNISIFSLSAFLLKLKKCNYKKCNWVSGSPSILYKLVLSPVRTHRTYKLSRESVNALQLVSPII